MIVFAPDLTLELLPAEEYGGGEERLGLMPAMKNDCLGARTGLGGFRSSSEVVRPHEVEEHHAERGV